MSNLLPEFLQAVRQLHAKVSGAEESLRVVRAQMKHATADIER